MSKRKRDNDHKSIKKSRHQYEPKIDTHIRELGNELLSFTPILVTISDDLHWPGISHTNGRSTYRLETFYINDDEKLIIIAETIKSSIKGRGKYCEFRAESLNIRNTEWNISGICLNEVNSIQQILDKKSIPKITMDELGHIHRSDHAQERSDEWARQVKKYRKLDEYVLILDGTGRNLNALLKIGIPSKYIILIERDPLTALYHKLLRIRLQENFETHWTQEIERHADDGVENLIHNGKLPHQTEITCAYFDFDSDIPSKLIKSLEYGKLPKLYLCGITQTWRNRKNKFPNIGEEIVPTYDRDGVTCKFMIVNYKKIDHNTFEILD
jgi:hypothetical protein